MNSVNHQQYAPYHANYEMPSKPASNPSEGSAKAPSAPSPSAPPRQPMSTQQRGQLSAHRGLVNSQASTAATDPGRLAQLSKENDQLRDQLIQMADQLNSVIGQLRQKVADLTQKISQPSTPDVSSGAKRSAAHDANASNESAPVSEQKGPQTLNELTGVNNQLRETINRMQIQFNEVVKQLQEQIQTLNKKLDERGGASTQAATQGSGAHANTSAGSQTVAPTPETREATSSETRTVDDVLLENDKLRDRIKEMIEQFTKVISELTQQIEQLSARVEAPAA